MLKIRKCTLEDCGHYSCEIMAYVKPGEESELECQLDVEGMLHPSRLFKTCLLTSIVFYQLMKPFSSRVPAQVHQQA